MKQNVNFYEKLEPEKALPKSLVWIGASLSVVIVGYLGYTGLLLFEKGNLARELEQLVSSNQQLERNMALEVEKSRQDSSDLLDAKLNHLRKLRQEKQLLIDSLRDPKLTNVTGFSEVLSGLARQHRQGIAIEKIAVAENGALFVLEGEVEDAREVPAYIVRLGKEEAFRDMSFETVKIAEVDARLSFELKSWTKI